MAENTILNPGSGGDIAAADDIAGVKYQRVKLTLGADGVNDGDVSAANPVPVAGSLSVDNFPAQTGLTDAELRAAPVPVQDVTAEDTRQAMVSLLTRMMAYLNSPQGYDKSLQRQRGTMVVESGTITTVTTVTTCAAVTSVNNLDGYNARMQILDNNRTAWAQCVRTRIT